MITGQTFPRLVDSRRIECPRCGGSYMNPQNAHNCYPIASRLPKIQQHLVAPYREADFDPLRRYRGVTPFGRMKAVYNFFCAGMELELPSVAKLSWAASEHGYTSRLGHWAGFHAYQTDRVVFNKFGTRLLANPDVARLTPHLLEYLQFLREEGGLREVRLTPLLVRQTDNGIEIVQQWPFMPREQQELVAPDAGMDLVNEVDSIVPRSLSKEVRSDVCQDLVVAVLLGDVKKENLRDAMPRLLKKAFALYPSKYRGLSLETPIGGDPDGRTIGSTLRGKDDSLGLCDDCEAFSEELQSGLCPRCYTALESSMRNRDAVVQDYAMRPHKRHGFHRGGDPTDLFEEADETEDTEPIVVKRGALPKKQKVALQGYEMPPVAVDQRQRTKKHWATPGTDYSYRAANPKRLPPRGDEWKGYPEQELERLRAQRERP